MINTENKSVNETLCTYTHSSGLRVRMVSKKGFCKSAAFFSTHYGSIDNEFVPIGEKDFIKVPDGIAHFLEHKVFEQPDNSNVFDMFSKYGASANAYTSFDMTTYYFWCTEHFKENLKTLTGFVQSPYFTDENVKKEQGIIGQEIGMYDDSPGWRCYFNMLGCLYKSFPVNRDIAGTVESISKITKETLYTCYNTFYHPSNMTLCMVGDFDTEDMKEYLDGILGSMESKPPVARKYPQEQAEIAKRETVQKMSVAMPMYMIGFKDMPQSNVEKRRAEVKIALELLLGKSSKLYNELYSEGLITPMFGMDYTAEKQYGFSEISDQTGNADKVFEKIKSAAASFKPSGEDIERIKRKTFGNGLGIFDDPEEYAGALARYETSGLNLYKMLEAYKNVTAEDVQKVFETHLTPDKAVLSKIEPLQ